MKKRIALIGTFDVQNYGDNLFPVVFQHEMDNRLGKIEVDFYGPYGREFNFGNALIKVKPLIKTRRGHLLNSYDAIVIGGGDIIRFDEKIVNGHYRDSAGERYRSGFKPLSAMLVSRPWWRFFKKPFIAWNAPGVLGGNQKMLRRLCASTDYITVRDAPSKDILQREGINADICVVPDTVLIIKEVLELLHLGIKPKEASHRKVVGFHCQEGFLKKKDTKEIVAKLMKLRSSFNVDIRLIPIGGCHGVVEFLNNLSSLSGGGFERVEMQMDPLRLIDMITQCDYFIGSSLHGNITAASFGIPHLAINTVNLIKTKGFFELIDRQKFCLNKWDEFESKVEILLAESSYSSINKVNNAKRVINKHFDSLAERICQN